MVLASRSIPVSRVLLALALVALVVAVALVAAYMLWPQLAHLVHLSSLFRAGLCPGSLSTGC
jgi:hypothetical protein